MGGGGEVGEGEVGGGEVGEGEVGEGEVGENGKCGQHMRTHHLFPSVSSRCQELCFLLLLAVT